MLDFIGRSIGQYIVPLLGLLVLKVLGWFGMGSIAFGLLFGIALAPVAFNVLLVLLLFLAGALGIITSRAKQADR